MKSRKQSQQSSPKKSLRVYVNNLNPAKIKKFYEDHHENITQICNEFRIWHERLQKNLSRVEI